MKEFISLRKSDGKIVFVCPTCAGHFEYEDEANNHTCAKGKIMHQQYTTTLPLHGGRVTIPEHIRKELRVKDGDLVVVQVSRADTRPQGNGANKEE